MACGPALDLTRRSLPQGAGGQPTGFVKIVGDAATGQIAGLTKLKTYYAGLTQITDRSLEILGRMSSLEKLEFYECKNITNAGLAFLAHLPRLREVDLHGLPNVTWEGTKVFPAPVRVKYSV